MKLKYMIVGFIAGVFAATAITAGASTVYEKFTAVARPDYTLVVNGEKVTLNTPPKTIEGVTHLPIREVATILGSDVNFKSGTITLTTKTESEGDSMEIKDFLSLNQISEQFGIRIVVGDDVTIGELVFQRPNGQPNRIEIITAEAREFHLKIENGIFYLSESELRGAGIIN